LIVAEGATVTIAEGASFYMHNNANLIIAGTVKAKGTLDKPIVFRGDRLDYIPLSVPLPYDLIHGQWGSIYFNATSYENEFDHVIVRNGLTGLTFRESSPDRLKIQINNSQITNMDSTTFAAYNCYIEAINSEFSNSTYATVMLAGGKYQFTHCTLANFMESGMMSHNMARLTPALTLADNITYTDTEKHTFPLLQAYFDNCIIDGNISGGKNEIAFDTGNDTMNGNDEQFNYRFNHCVIATKKTDNDRFNEVIFLENTKTDIKQYIKSKAKNDEDKYDFIYDFRITKESAATGKADRSIAEQFPTDRFGVNRLTSESGPSIGAYEYVPQEDDKK